MHVRVCRDCGEEYRPDVAVCADCGGELEDRWDDGSEAPRHTGLPVPAPEAEAEAAAEQSEVVHATAFLPDLRPLMDTLAQAGVSFRVTPRRTESGEGASGYELRVDVGDRERAVSLLTPLLAADVEPHVRDAVEREFDSERGYRRCPACAATLRPGAPECPECGLALAGGEE